MRRLGFLAAIVLSAGTLALRPGARPGDGPPVREARARGGEEAPAASPRPDDAPAPGPVEPIWVAIDFVDLESGGSSEYIGRVDPEALSALLDGRLDGFLRLDEVFWLFEDGEVERLDDDLAFGGSAYFRADAIRRVTPVKDGFPEAARPLPPGDRIVPGPGRDA